MHDKLHKSHMTKNVRLEFYIAFQYEFHFMQVCIFCATDGGVIKDCMAASVCAVCVCVLGGKGLVSNNCLTQSVVAKSLPGLAKGVKHKK